MDHFKVYLCPDTFRPIIDLKLRLNTDDSPEEVRQFILDQFFAITGKDYYDRSYVGPIFMEPI